jgi:hypothetical protein
MFVIGLIECEFLNVSFEIHWILSKCKRKRRIFMVTGGVLTSNKGNIGLDGVSQNISLRSFTTPKGKEK